MPTVMHYPWRIAYSPAITAPTAGSSCYRRRICNALGITILCARKNNYRSKKIKFYTADI
jgi:hypothetical protein